MNIERQTFVDHFIQSGREVQDTYFDNAKSKLKVGAWYSFKSRHLLDTNFCVLEIKKDGKIICEVESWLYGNKLTFENKEALFNWFYCPEFLGYGRKTFIRAFIRKSTNCFFTIYTKPTSISIFKSTIKELCNLFRPKVF